MTQDVSITVSVTSVIRLEQNNMKQYIKWMGLSLYDVHIRTDKCYCQYLGMTLVHLTLSMLKATRDALRSCTYSSTVDELLFYVSRNLSPIRDDSIHGVNGTLILFM